MQNRRRRGESKPRSEGRQRWDGENLVFAFSGARSFIIGRELRKAVGISVVVGWSSDLVKKTWLRPMWMLKNEYNRRLFVC